LPYKGCFKAVALKNPTTRQVFFSGAMGRKNKCGLLRLLGFSPCPCPIPCVLSCLRDPLPPGLKALLNLVDRIEVEMLLPGAFFLPVLRSWEGLSLSSGDRGVLSWRGLLPVHMSRQSQEAWDE
tara:strand:- start:182 stop:553 length:372 start_codon:yes stop_codon:yes gene_type:complete